MTNIQLKVTKNNKLVLIVDLTRDGAFTKSCRSRQIASSGGSVLLWKDGLPHPDSARFNLHVFRSLRPEEKQEAERRRRDSL